MTAVPSRRTFLRRIARDSVGLALFPALGMPPALERHRPPPLPRVAPDDETYWKVVRAQFIIRDGLIPLNAANLCPAPHAVVEAAAAALRDIDGDVSFQNRAKYDGVREGVRRKLAGTLGVLEDEIAIVRNTSEGNNIVVGGLALKPGDEVLVFDQNHPTNNVAWDVRAARFGFTVRRVGVQAPPASADQLVDVFRRALSNRTRVLTFTDVSNTSGIRLPARQLCRLARERGIYTHIDGAQTLGALRLDLHEIGCDSYAASAHKWLMGPKEAGVLYVRAERVPELWPGMVGLGWGTNVAPAVRGARKFETLGQRNDATLAALGTALDFRDLVGPGRIEARVLELAAAMRDGLARIPGSTLVSPAGPDLAAGVVVARFERLDHREIFERLYARHGVAGAATGGLRLCPHVYNTQEDVARALAAVGEVVAGLRRS